MRSHAHHYEDDLIDDHGNNYYVNLQTYFFARVHQWLVEDDFQLTEPTYMKINTHKIV